ncbi:MAG: Bax protein [Pseudoalteromonas tetraodonis]
MRFYIIAIVAFAAMGCQPATVAPASKIDPPEVISKPDAVVQLAEIVKQLPTPQPDQSIAEKKHSFIALLLPIIEYENKLIEKKRERLLTVNPASPNAEQQEWLAQLAIQYRLDASLISKERYQELLIRVDQIPANLAISQGAIESAWGKSRFAREGNNLFGHWCYETGCGLVPKRRAAGQKHEVKRFKSVNASVRAYMYNLNTHNAYKSMRSYRAELRAADKPLSASVLAQGLTHYSERGQDYVNSVKNIIKSNRPLINKVKSD